MTIVLVGNTKSGRGLAAKLLDRFTAAIQTRGLPVTKLTLNDTNFPPESQFNPERFRGARAILALGGDGTVNAVAPPAIRTNTPVYHVPCGNENLIARRYKMDRNPQTFLSALGRYHIIQSDVGLAAGRRFLIMASAGPDAQIIKSLHHTRIKAIGHLAYLGPILREAAAPYLPRLTLSVDGSTKVQSRQGWLIIANDREYGARLNFVPSAGPTTQSLSAVFLPANNLADCLQWALLARAGRLARNPRAIFTQGTEFTIHTQSPIIQIDGEHHPDFSENSPIADEITEVKVTLDQDQLPILAPDPASFKFQ